METRKEFAGGVLLALKTMSAFLALGLLLMACEPGLGIGASDTGGLAGAIHTVEWTPDGSQIVYSAGIDYGRSIYVRAADGSHRRAVARGRIGRNPLSNVSPRISPDGSRVAYAGLVKTGLFGSGGYGWEIFTSRIDGSDRRRLTKNTVTDTNPTWSPDGTRLAFISERGLSDPSEGVHYTMAADGSDVRSLTTFRFTYKPPIWSPDGRHIAILASDLNEPPAIYIVDADGSDQRKIADTWTAFPSWSPDSQHLVFVVSDVATRYEQGIRVINPREGVYTAKADGADLRQIVGEADLPDTHWRGAQVAWSPDGSEILLAGHGALFVFRPDGSGLRRLHAEPSGYSPSGEKYNYNDRDGVRTRAAWSPDGSRIAFYVVPPQTGGRLTTMARDGTDVRVLR